MDAFTAKAPAATRPKMQAGIVREFFCPNGWPKHSKTLVYSLVACANFRHEDTCNAYIINEAMSALRFEKEYERGQFSPPAFDHAELSNRGLRLMPKMPVKIYCVSAIGLKVDCIIWRTQLGMAARIVFLKTRKKCISPISVLPSFNKHLPRFPIATRKFGRAFMQRAAIKHQADMKMWGTVGKAQHDPGSRFPAGLILILTLEIISLWPLVQRATIGPMPICWKVLDKAVATVAGAPVTAVIHLILSKA